MRTIFKEIYDNSRYEIVADLEAIKIDSFCSFKLKFNYFVDLYLNKIILCIYPHILKNTYLITEKGLKKQLERFEKEKETMERNTDSI